MCYGFYSHPGWFPPWEPYEWPTYSMFGGWPPPYPPYGWMGQMPFPPGAWMAPFGPPMTPQQEVEFLRNQAQMLKEELDQIDNRISELEREAR